MSHHVYDIDPFVFILLCMIMWGSASFMALSRRPVIIIIGLALLLVGLVFPGWWIMSAEG
jgi:hypothetical protein